MRALLQRCSEGGVYIKEPVHTAEITKGLVILLGIKNEDTQVECDYLATKVLNQRVFEDENGKMNLSVKDVKGEVLIISQFTLYGETKKGNRPDFTSAAKPPLATDLYNRFVEKVKEELGENFVKTGIFGAMMSVKIINDGPVTILVESKN